MVDYLNSTGLIKEFRWEASVGKLPTFSPTSISICVLLPRSLPNSLPISLPIVATSLHWALVSCEPVVIKNDSSRSYSSWLSGIFSSTNFWCWVIAPRLQLKTGGSYEASFVNRSPARFGSWTYVKRNKLICFLLFFFRVTTIVRCVITVAPLWGILHSRPWLLLCRQFFALLWTELKGSLFAAFAWILKAQQLLLFLFILVHTVYRVIASAFLSNHLLDFVELLFVFEVAKHEVFKSERSAAFLRLLPYQCVLFLCELLSCDSVCYKRACGAAILLKKLSKLGVCKIFFILSL